MLWASVLLGRQMPWASLGGWRIAQMVGVVGAVWCWRRGERWFVLVVAAVGGALAGAGAWWAVPTVHTGECAGRAVVVGEAEPIGRGVRAVVRLDGVRMSVRAHGRPAWRLARVRSGESVVISGSCRPVDGRLATWQHSRHVLGEMTVSDVSESVGVASPVARSVYRLHDALHRGARSLTPDDSALYSGLVVGADARQPRDMVEAFRRTGLGHLTAVSGQNVAYVMALVGAVVATRRRRVRAMVMLIALGWFALLTRAEPSVVRAVSAGVVTVFVGGARGPAVVSASIAAALCVDPLLAHSVGFQLSCAAAIGLTLGTAPLTRLLGGGRMSRVAAPTVAAQLATLPLSWGYFGLTPAMAIPANLCAAPVAGVVMLIGLPIGLAASALPDAVAAAAMLPVAAMVRWVWWVAHAGASVRVPAWVDVLCWATLIATLLVRGLRVRAGATGPL